MMDFTLDQILWSLALGARWTVVLSASAFLFGGVLGFALMLGLISKRPAVHGPVMAMVWFVQSTPLLMQLFLIFFGLPLLGYDMPAWGAAGIALTLWSSVYFAEIWRGAVRSVPTGQAEAAQCLGLLPRQSLRYVILPQAVRIALPPTAGFMVQIVKSTSLTSIVGFTELMKTGTILANVTLDPFVVYGLVSVLYFSICYPYLLPAAKWRPFSMSLVKIEALHKSYGNMEVLRGLDLSVEPGEVIALIGKSGSGKSTFLRCINELETINSGRVLIDGEAVDQDQRRLQQVRLKVGMIFQQFNLFPHLTALDNTALALKVVKGFSRQEARVISLNKLEKVGLGDRANARPHQLSGGQQQRVAIARALAMDPVVLLCDEVTSALDPELVEEVLQVIRQLAKDGMTVIMVTHEMSFARSVCSRVVFMHQGRIHEIGPPDEVFGNPKTLELQQFLGLV